MKRSVGRPKLADKELKKKSYIMIIISVILVSVLVITCVLLNINTKLLKGSTSACDEKCTYRKKVAAVAEQYLYNKYNTNYEKHQMGESFAFRNINVIPSEVSKSNEVNFDCSSFIANVYAVSTGFTFKELIATDNNIKDYSNKFHNLGMGPRAVYYVNVAEKYKGSNLGISVYYKTITGNESSKERKKIYDTMISKFQTGDVFATSLEDKSGHTMLYVKNIPLKVDGNYVLKNGFIHSTGRSYNPDAFKNGQFNVGNQDYYDEYSVRYRSEEKFYDYIFDGKKRRLAIIRPINYITKKSYDKFKKYNEDNIEALTELKDYSFNSYMVKDKTYFTKYNSVKKGDIISNRLEIKKKSGKEDRLVVRIKLPDGVEFVSCSNEPCKYDESNRIVTWQNADNSKSYRVYKTIGVEGRYTVNVKVNTSSNIVFNSFNISKSGSSKTYNMANINVLVNNKKDNLDPKYIKNNFVNSLFTYSNDTYKIKSSANNDIYKHLVPGLYGGTKLEGNNLKNRSKWFKTEFLDIGDIVVSYNNKDTNYYVYKGNGIFKNEDGSEVNLNRYIEVVMSRDLYAVIRP